MNLLLTPEVDAALTAILNAATTGSIMPLPANALTSSSQATRSTAMGITGSSFNDPTAIASNWVGARCRVDIARTVWLTDQGNVILDKGALAGIDHVAVTTDDGRGNVTGRVMSADGEVLNPTLGISAITSVGGIVGFLKQDAILESDLPVWAAPPQDPGILGSIASFFGF